MKNLNILLFALLATAMLLCGCVGTDTTEQYYGGNGAAGLAGIPPSPTMPSSADYGKGQAITAQESGGTAAQDRLVVKTGSAEVEVPAGTIEARYAAFGGIVSSLGGEITSSSYYETENGKTYYATVRLDPAKFDQLGSSLSQVGTVKSISTGSEDVTTQYIDVSARLQNLEASRDRLLELYNRTDNISDILQLEQELTRLQSDIDSTTQQKLYYERQASRATMSVTITEPVPAVDSTVLNPLGQLANVFLGALVFGLTLVVGALGFGIPAAVALAILYLLVKVLYLDRRKKEKPPPEKK